MALGLSLNLMASAVRRAGRALAQRYFHDLDAAAAQYYLPSSQVTLTSNFEIEIPIYTTSLATNTRFLSFFSGIVGDNLYLTLNYAGYDGKIKIESAGYTPGGGTIVVNDGVVHTIRLAYSSPTLSLYVDDVLDYSVTHAAPNRLEKTLDFLAGAAQSIQSDSPFSFLTGIIPSLKIWTGGDRDTGTLVHHWEFNTPLTSPIIPDLAGGNNATAINMTSADAELFTLNKATSPDQWENADKTRIIPIAGTP